MPEEIKDALSGETVLKVVTADDVAEILRSHGLTDRPRIGRDGMHSRQCEYPELYGWCSCFDDLVAAILDLVTDSARAAAGQLEARVRSALELHELVDVDGVGICGKCSSYDRFASSWTDVVVWPCSTARALEG